MSSSKTRARHRSATRPTTPFTNISKSLAGVDTKKGLMVAATTGIAMSITAGAVAFADPGTDTAPVTEQPQATEINTAKVANPVAEAQQALSANPEIQVGEVAWEANNIGVAEAEAPAPEPTRPAQTATQQTAAAATATAAAEVATPSVVADIAPSAIGGSILDIAMRYQGVPYVYGGTTPRGFDCSGFTQYVFRQAGIGLPRTSWAQGSAGTRISASQAQPGDLVYYGGHIGIYAGNGMMIHSPHPGTTVRLQSVYGSPTYVRVG